MSYDGVHPFDGDDARTELDRLATLGVRWLKLHPNTQSFDVAAPEVAAVVAHAGDLGITVLFDAYSPWDPAQPGKLLRLAMTHTRTRLVLAHMFGSRFDDAVTYAAAGQHYPELMGSVYFDLSFVVPTYAGGPYAEQLVWVVRQVGVDRFLFGSDYPLYSPGASLEALRRLGFTAEEEHAICHDNAVSLLD